MAHPDHAAALPPYLEQHTRQNTATTDRESEQNVAVGEPLVVLLSDAMIAIQLRSVDAEEL